MSETQRAEFLVEHEDELRGIMEQAIDEVTNPYVSIKIPRTDSEIGATGVITGGLRTDSANTCDRTDAQITAGGVLRDKLQSGELRLDELSKEQLTCIDAWETAWFDKQRQVRTMQKRKDAQLPSAYRSDSKPQQQVSVKAGDSPTMAVRKNRQLPNVEF